MYHSEKKSKTLFFQVPDLYSNGLCMPVQEEVYGMLISHTSIWILDSFSGVVRNRSQLSLNMPITMPVFIPRFLLFFFFLLLDFLFLGER